MADRPHTDSEGPSGAARSTLRFWQPCAGATSVSSAPPPFIPDQYRIIGIGLPSLANNGEPHSGHHSLTVGPGMEEDWRREVEAHRPQIVLWIKQKLEKLVAPRGDGASQDTKLIHIARGFEAMQWRDASTRQDYAERHTERFTTKLNELEAQVSSAVPAPTAAAVVTAKGRGLDLEVLLHETCSETDGTWPYLTKLPPPPLGPGNDETPTDETPNLVFGGANPVSPTTIHADIHGTRQVYVGKHIEVEVKEEDGSIVWKLARVRRGMTNGRFEACIDNDPDFIEEYSWNHHVEWRHLSPHEAERLDTIRVKNKMTLVEWSQISKYEMERLGTMQANKEMLTSLGLGSTPSEHPNDDDLPDPDSRESANEWYSNDVLNALDDEYTNVDLLSALDDEDIKEAKDRKRRKRPVDTVSVDTVSARLPKLPRHEADSMLVLANMNGGEVERKLQMVDPALSLADVLTKTQGHRDKVKYVSASQSGAGKFEAKLVERLGKPVPVNFYLGIYNSVENATVAITVFAALIGKPDLQDKLLTLSSVDENWSKIVDMVTKAVVKKALVTGQLPQNRRRKLRKP